MTGICSFPISVDESVDVDQTLFFDASGTLVRVQVHVKEEDVFRANGISLRGLPYSANLDVDVAPDGTLTAAKAVGIAEKIRLPDGRLFIIVGFADLLNPPPGQVGITLYVNHGNPGNTTALCNALTP